MTVRGDEQSGKEGQESRPVAELLSENHRRVLANTLRRVELAAWHLEEQLARETIPHLTLTRFTHPPSPEQRSMLLQLAQQIRRQVTRLVEDYHLEVGEQDMLRTIMGEFTLLWCDLEDIRPRKLRAYGAVNPQLQAMLDPPLKRLIELVLAVDGVASGKLELAHVQQNIEESNTEEKGARAFLNVNRVWFCLLTRMNIGMATSSAIRQKAITPGNEIP